jgi:hypothetical protein
VTDSGTGPLKQTRWILKEPAPEEEQRNPLRIGDYRYQDVGRSRRRREAAAESVVAVVDELEATGKQAAHMGSSQSELTRDLRRVLGDESFDLTFARRHSAA